MASGPEYLELALEVIPLLDEVTLGSSKTNYLRLKSLDVILCPLAMCAERILQMKIDTQESGTGQLVNGFMGEEYLPLRMTDLLPPFTRRRWPSFGFVSYNRQNDVSIILRQAPSSMS